MSEPRDFSKVEELYHAALACHMANEAYFRNEAVTWDAAAGRIVS